MLVNEEMLKRFNACSSALRQFAELFPEGVDISGLWGTPKEAGATWKAILEDRFLKKHAGWAIVAGILPAKIRANLRGANLCGADLYGADLRGADLCGADLREADLCGADLFGANLCGANLYGADLRGADLRGISHEYTIWPDGFKPPDE